MQGLLSGPFEIFVSAHLPPPPRTGRLRGVSGADLPAHRAIQAASAICRGPSDSELLSGPLSRATCMVVPRPLFSAVPNAS